jgi:uncharacterized membrane protein
MAVEHYQMTRQGIRDLNNPIRPRRAKTNVGPDERAMSTVAGAVLAGLGVEKGGLIGLALAALGGGLIYRGQTGHCSLYAATGVNTNR